MSSIVTITVNGVQKSFRKKFRMYTLSLVRTAVVSAAFTGSIQIEPSEAPFILTSLHAEDTADGTTLTTLEPWLASLQDNESSYFWNDGFGPRTGLFGGREFGNQLNEEIYIRGNTRLSISVQNRAAGAVAGTAQISLRGWNLIPIQ